MLKNMKIPRHWSRTVESSLVCVWRGEHQVYKMYPTKFYFTESLVKILFKVYIYDESFILEPYVSVYSLPSHFHVYRYFV